jgi:hypothetical protein
MSSNTAHGLELVSNVRINFEGCQAFFRHLFGTVRSHHHPKLNSRKFLIKLELRKNIYLIILPDTGRKTYIIKTSNSCVSTSQNVSGWLQIPATAVHVERTSFQ